MYIFARVWPYIGIALNLQFCSLSQIKHTSITSDAGWTVCSLCIAIANPCCGVAGFVWRAGTWFVWKSVSCGLSGQIFCVAAENILSITRVAGSGECKFDCVPGRVAAGNNIDGEMTRLESTDWWNLELTMTTLLPDQSTINWTKQNKRAGSSEWSADGKHLVPSLCVCGRCAGRVVRGWSALEPSRAPGGSGAGSTQWRPLGGV